MISGLPQPLVLPLDRRRGFVETRVEIGAPTVLAISHDGYGEIRWLRAVEDIEEERE